MKDCPTSKEIAIALLGIVISILGVLGLSAGAGAALIYAVASTTIAAIISYLAPSPGTIPPKDKRRLQKLSGHYSEEVYQILL